MQMKVIALSIALLVFALGAFVAYRWPRQQLHLEEEKVLTAVPFTALPGRATSPALSADGSRIAFAWNGGPAQATRGFDLYVKAVGSETLLRLTQHPADWISPAWSPDGTQIAFHRLAGPETGIYVVPAMGGAERRLLSTKIPDHTVSRPSVGPQMVIGSPTQTSSPQGKAPAFTCSPPRPWSQSRFRFLRRAFAEVCRRFPTRADR